MAALAQPSTPQVTLLGGCERHPAVLGLIDNLAGHVELDAFIAPQAW